MSAESPRSAVLSQVCRYWVPLAVSAASQMPLSSARFPLSASRALAQQRAQSRSRSVGRSNELRAAYLLPERPKFERACLAGRRMTPDVSAVSAQNQPVSPCCWVHASGGEGRSAKLSTALGPV